MIDFLKTLLEISFISSIMIVIVFGIRYFLSKKMNPIIIYVLWLIVLIRLLVPVTINSPVHLDGLFAAVENGKQDIVNIETTESTSSDVSYNTEPNTYASMEIDDFTEPAAVVSREKITYTLWEKIAKNIKSISLWDVLGVIWISGVIAAIFITGRKVLLFKRRIMAHSYESDELIKRIVYRQLANSGIKKSIRIYTCEQADVPMIFGYFKPILIIPKGLLKTLDKDKIELIILHEIGHVRRHDILFSYLWLGAKIIHWFNPMIWIANKLYKDDVEFCCDQWVINRLKEKNKFDYGQALIDAARMSKASGLLPVTVAFFEDKYKLKERVSRMVGLRQKSKSAIIITSILSFIMVVMCFTTACQPTPENNVVIQKDNYENHINTTASPNDSIISDSNIDANEVDGANHIYWQDVFAKDFQSVEAGQGYDRHELTITVDADIIVPKETASVYLVEPAEFTKEFAQEAADYFFSGTYYDDIYTKDDWMIKILPIEQALVNMIDFQDGISSIESRLRIYKKYYKMASENNSQGTLEFEQGRFRHIAAKGYPYNNAVAELYVGNGGMQYTDFYYVVDDGQQIYKESTEEYKGISANGMEKSYDEALQIASDAVYKLFGNETTLAQTTLARKIAIDENYPLTSKGYYDDYNQCYIFYFTPVYNGIPQLYAPEAQNDNDRNSGGEPVYSQSWDYEYSMKWPAEYTKVMVDDKGIVELWSFSPSKIVEKVNSNVQMLPFDDIFEIFKKNIFYSSAWDDNSTLKIDINIDKIVFGMIRTPVKDNPSQYYMVPAWQFIGSKSSVTRGPDETLLSQFPEKTQSEMEYLSQYLDYYESGKTFMVLNAIDGSIIDTSYFFDVEGELEKYIGVKKE